MNDGYWKEDILHASDKLVLARTVATLSHVYLNMINIFLGSHIFLGSCLRTRKISQSEISKI